MVEGEARDGVDAFSGWTAALHTSLDLPFAPTPEEPQPPGATIPLICILHMIRNCHVTSNGDIGG